MADRKRRARQIALVVTVALIVAGMVLALVVGPGTSNIGSGAEPAPGAPIVLPPPPEVPPAIFAEEAPDDARASNAEVPIAPGRPPPAPPFHYSGAPADRAAAEACLTAALLYEAGDDPPGERAVAQVVLNRLRHPVFPKTVCGVILQGSERHTGCQFTFTCDGSLARVPSAPAWERARRIAAAALGGAVDRSVGTATHYHTDWVVPYWRSTLVKIAVVHTQIFYRWPGPWGTRAVLTGKLQPGEVADARMARLANLPLGPGATPPAESIAPVPALALAVEGVPAVALHGTMLRLKDEDAGQFVLQLDPASPPGSYAAAAAALCGEKLECAVYGWTGVADLPRGLPVTAGMMRGLAFAYRRSRSLGLAQAYWDCHRFARPTASECFTD